MQKVATQKDEKTQLIEKDRKRAEKLMEAYASMKDDEAKLKTEMEDKVKPFKEDFEQTVKTLLSPYTDRVSTLATSIQEAEKELLEIGERQKKKLFETDGNWRFESGYYLHIKSETVVKLDTTFDLSKFVKKFSDYIDVKFKIKELKKFFANGDQRNKMVNMGLDLKLDETVEIKKKAETE